MLRLAIIGDIHFGRGNADRLYDELSIFKNYIDSYSNSVDGVIIVGDLYDRVLKMNESASRRVIEFITWLSDKKIPVRIIRGTRTHDHNQLSNFRSMVSENFKIYESVNTEEMFPGFNVLYIPEEYEDISYYDEYFSNEYDLIVGHGTIDFTAFMDTGGNSIKGAPVFSRKLFDEISKVTVFGHIHNGVSEGNCYYTGSYSRGNFAELSDKGFIILTIDNDKYEVKRIINDKAPTYKSLDIDELKHMTNEEKLSYISECHSKYDHVKIITKDKNNENIELIKTATKGTDIKVEMKAKVETKRIDPEYEFVLDRTLPLDEVVVKFIKAKYGKTVDKELIDDVLNDNI